MSRLQPRYVVPIAAEVAPEPELFGQKGAGLLVMRRLGLPVPPGFILTTQVGRLQWPAAWDTLWTEIEPALATLSLQGAKNRKTTGEGRRPLLLAVRASPVVSMPGMLDTLLHVGFHPGTVEELFAWTCSRAFALDCQRRFLRQCPGGLKSARPGEELRDAIAQVLRSAMAPRAQDYRRMYGLDEDLGIAVVVQAMVYGNLGERSATGVLFTRDPSTGEPMPPVDREAPRGGLGSAPYGEYLGCAQGEDVVSGTQVPRSLGEMGEQFPEAYAELLEYGRRLERHLSDMQDIEFTIEEGKLWLLQTRTGKRSGRAMVRIAADLCREGQLVQQAALLRIEPRRLAEVLRPTIAPGTERVLLCRGLPASPGVATGRVVFSTAEVQALARLGQPAILVRVDTSPEDILGIQLSQGLLTARGGMTSHAAVVARGLGRCAVVGASALQIDYEEEAVSTREYTVRRDELITLDGNTGEVLIGEVPLAVSHLVADDALKEVLSWTGKAGLRVYALADTMAEWQLGRELQASGIVFRRHRPIPASASLPDATRQREPSVLVLSELSPSPPPSRLGTELSDATDEELLLGAATGCDFVMLSFDLGQKLDETVRLLRSVVPKLHLGLCTTRLHSDEVTVVARALALGLDFVACPPLRTAIARVAAAHPPINK